MIVTTTELQNNFGKFLKLSEYEEILITKNGNKVAKLIPYVENEREGCLREGAAVYKQKNIRVTYQEFLHITQESENRYEYIDGELYFLASPLYPHQRAVREILSEMITYFRGKECEPLAAPFDITLYRNENDDDIHVVQPDIIIICDRENICEDGKYRGTPTLLVEVLSESTKSKDLIKKLDLYMESGVAEYWVVNTATAEIYIYVFADRNIQTILTSKKEEKAKSNVFLGLEVNLKQVFVS